MSTARELVELLRKRHTEDVFVPECAIGGGGQDSTRRLDAWAMSKSWAKPRYFGYEIKVSRSDFLRDDKWPVYLSVCSQFSFVCPYGLIAPEETPEGVGLIWTSKNATRLYTKRKAPFREIEPPETLFRYLLMGRTLVQAPYVQQTKKQRWEQWLQYKRENRELGYNLSGELRRTVEERVHKVQAENENLQGKIRNLEQVKAVLDELGIDSAGYIYNIRMKLEDAIRPGKEALLEVNRATSALDKLRSVLEKIGVDPEYTDARKSNDETDALAAHIADRRQVNDRVVRLSRGQGRQAE